MKNSIENSTERRRSPREVLEDEVREDLEALTQKFEEKREKLSDEEVQEILVSLLNISLLMKNKG